MLIKLKDEDLHFAMKNGEFAPEIRNKAQTSIVILTQGWCSQWQSLLSAIQKTESISNVPIFFVEYDKISFFESFMEFKETHFSNNSVPYVRYYRDGKLINESNYVSIEAFIRKAKLF